MILILCSSRTGSSMVANVFVKHGCNTGKCFPGSLYKFHENAALKAAVRECWDSRNERGKPINPTTEQLKYIKGIVSRETVDPFLFKCGAEYGPLFALCSPRVVKIYRDREQAIKSTLEKTSLTRYEIGKAYDNRMEYLNYIKGTWVDSEAVSTGDYSTLQAAVEYCGLAFDPSLADHAIVPGLLKQR